MYTPSSNASGPITVIHGIVEKCCKEIRHMDSIDHDPEGQRVKKLVLDACVESFKLGFSPDDGKTTHITSAKDIELEIKGKEGIKDAKVIQEAMPAHHIALCGICSAVHDPRKVYDHSSQPLRRTG